MSLKLAQLLCKHRVHANSAAGAGPAIVSAIVRPYATQSVPGVGGPSALQRQQERTLTSYTSTSCLENKRRVHHRQPALNAAWPRYRSTLAATDASGSAASEHDWSDAVTEAEEEVGQLTALGTLRNLLGDELADVGMFTKRLLESGHPLLKSSRGHLLDATNATQIRGLTALLLAKALAASNASQQPLPDGSTSFSSPSSPASPSSSASSSSSGAPVTPPAVLDIVPSQRSLAEISELIYAANVVHDGIVDIDGVGTAAQNDGNSGGDSTSDDEDSANASEHIQGLIFGNKMAILGGDFLLASACTGLSRLQSAPVVSMMSAAIGDAVEGSFATYQYEKDTSAFEGSYLGMTQWSNLASLKSGSLISRTCQGIAWLGGHPESLQVVARSFGDHVGLAFQVDQELKAFTASGVQIEEEAVQLLAVPVVLAAENAPEEDVEFLRLCLGSTAGVGKEDRARVLRIVDQNDGINRARALRQVHVDRALAVLSGLQESNARTRLENLLASLATRG